MKNIKKGFTLIELLAVIVILAVIALIITPVINNIIESTKKSAYKASVENIVDATSNFNSQYMIDNLNDVKATTFTCDGVSCTNGVTSLSFNGNVPKSGTISIDDKQNITINYVTDGKYCASGTKGNINVTSTCAYLDTTAPVINSDYTLQSTSNSVVVTIPSGYATDTESNVVSYKIDLYNGSTLVKEDIRTDINSTITESFTGLTNSTTYNVSVIAVNGNNLTTNKDKSITTNNITNPSISYTNNPTTAVNGYLLSEVAMVTFNKSNITNPTYYIKTTRAGISNLNIVTSCGTNTMPGLCTSIDSTTTLLANTWYQVTDNILLTYNTSDSNIGTLYALTYDGTNYSGAVTGTISKIDNTNPTVTTSAIGKTITLTMTDANSGVSAYCVNTNNTSSGCTWTSITNSTNTTATYTVSTAVNYYVFIKDGVGNISNVSSVDSSLLCSYDLNQIWNYDYTGSTATFTTPCNGTYKLEVWGAEGYSINIYNGGYGGYSTGNINLVSNTPLYINIGKQGNGGLATDNVSYIGNGGGATYMALTNSLITAMQSTYTQNLIILGAGGGASTWTSGNGWSGYGGSGGGIVGNPGVCAISSFTPGGGGTQTAGGSAGNYAGAGAFGIGGAYSGYNQGGSGLFGGGGSWGSAAGGGSGYIGNSSLTSKHMTCYNCTTSSVANTYTNTTTNVSSTATSDYAKTGNGYAKITLISY